ncbi:GNAT family N-acetyltransferase [Methanoplanus limicola]|uniref:GCN5-related N-acetyltransferase n=1 Tax=Methanoplanus limicola DSM 2279 TaxID=937775 RepID=H1Z2K4_9EURY|nr:GNAT family N-acetyltransferase [Methanoplanus limicola]EHQ35530.1 GCN5-related N-acetyltransferase [Methanoplanus limicola DSM 2279]
MKIPFNQFSFSIIDPNTDISGFECDNPDLNDFLYTDAIHYQEERLAVTRLIHLQNNVVGYFTLVSDSIEVAAIHSDDGNFEYPYRRYPALKIARLATDSHYQKQGIGRAMLLKTMQIAIVLSGYIGVRILTVDSKHDSVEFYEKFGFKRATRKNHETISLYRDFHRTLCDIQDKREESDITKY